MWQLILLAATKANRDERCYEIVRKELGNVTTVDILEPLFKECPRGRGPRKNWQSIVHYHIAKNAGTTVREVLKKRYGGVELHGPKKQPYAKYFRSDDKWRGRYFVAFARRPLDKLLSQFKYARTELSGSFGKWHRCVDFGEYVASRRARHNHQFSQLFTDQPACGGLVPKLRHETGAVNVTHLCPWGLDALHTRIVQVLAQPRLFVGIVELFDASMLALQAEIGLPDVTYCRRRLSSSSGSTIPDAVVDVANALNNLDILIVAVATVILQWKLCCFDITDDTLADFRRLNSDYQRRHCKAAWLSEKPRTASANATGVRDPMWRSPACNDDRKRRPRTFAAPLLKQRQAD